MRKCQNLLYGKPEMGKLSWTNVISNESKLENQQFKFFHRTKTVLANVLFIVNLINKLFLPQCFEFLELYLLYVCKCVVPSSYSSYKANNYFRYCVQLQLLHSAN